MERLFVSHLRLVKKLTPPCLFGFLAYFLISSLALADEKEVEPPKTGNFALPTAQQPGALVSFGQNMLDKGQTQVFAFLDDYVGDNKHAADVVPSILYAVTDNFSIFFNVPIAASYKQGAKRSSGLEDMFLQLEYAYYNYKNSDFVDLGTIVANMTFPTGSSDKQPPTGAGAPSYFLGTTLVRMYNNWFGFVSPGVVLTTSHDGTKFGNQYLYQAGFGRNIYSIPSKLIVDWMVEIDGQYTEENKINDNKDPNSGGNVVYVTPSLWISGEHLVVQLGAGFLPTQHLFGNQNRNNYLLVANFGWTFL